MSGGDDFIQANRSLIEEILTSFEQKLHDGFMSQQKLDEQLDGLLKTLESIEIDEELISEISKAAKRIVELKRRTTLVNSIINNSTIRCQSILESNRSGNHNVMQKKNSTAKAQEPSPASSTKR